MTPGDAPDVLVAMNPAGAARRTSDVPRGADVIVNTDEFTKRNLTRVGYATNPLEDGSLEATTSRRWRSPRSPSRRSRTSTSRARRASGRRTCSRSACCRGSTTGRSRGRSSSSSRSSRPGPRSSRPTSRFPRGWNYGETTEDFSVSYEVKPARLPAGRYRNISGNLALSYGLIAASRQSGLPLFLGAYPITPASDILHELSKHKRFGVRTFQAEDEIAGVGAALGRRSAAHSASRRRRGPVWRSRPRRSGSPCRWSYRW
jgi:2-oxoglutarate ferredoxin oxidoreductase subunit alpha